MTTPNDHALLSAYLNHYTPLQSCLPEGPDNGVYSYQVELVEREGSIQGRIQSKAEGGS